MTSMTRVLAPLAAAIGLLAFSNAESLAAPAIGEPAPAFTAATAAGKTISLAEFRGKPVILEWTSHQCPFVYKHYQTGNMQKLQRRLTAAGAVWISIISAAPGEPGHVSAEQARRIATRNASYADHILLDPTGEVGRAYLARTTPQMALIRPDGTLAYNGAIDNAPSTQLETVNTADNYLLAAFQAVQAGVPADPAVTKPYGCAIKY